MLTKSYRNRKYKLISVGKGCKLYRVIRVEDNLSTDITVSGNGLGPKGLPWQVRWTDIFSTKHEANFRTRTEVANFLEVR